MVGLYLLGESEIGLCTDLTNGIFFCVCHFWGFWFSSCLLLLLFLLCNVETTIRCKNVIMNCTMYGCCIRWRKQPTILKREDTPGNWMSLVVSVLVQFGLFLYWISLICICVGK